MLRGPGTYVRAIPASAPAGAGVLGWVVVRRRGSLAGHFGRRADGPLVTQERVRRARQLPPLGHEAVAGDLRVQDLVRRRRERRVGVTDDRGVGSSGAAAAQCAGKQEHGYRGACAHGKQRDERRPQAEPSRTRRRVIVVRQQGPSRTRRCTVVLGQRGSGALSRSASTRRSTSAASSPIESTPVRAYARRRRRSVRQWRRARFAAIPNNHGRASAVRGS
jgi:hypothetical protein